MKNIGFIKAVFSFWALLIVMSVLWLIYILYNNVHLIYSNMLVLSAFFVACISFTLSISFVFLIVFFVRKEIKKEKKKQKSIRDVYQYKQIADTPSMYN